MKRGDVIDKVRRAAKAQGSTFDTVELTRHTAIIVDKVSRTLGRHSDINDVAARKFWDEFAEVFGGKGWWR